MHGPQALASTNPPIDSKVCNNPSRSIVYRICSEPGVTVNSDFAFRFLASACLATEAERVISSYDELVQEPINATSNFSGHPSFFTASLNFEIGQAKSGV